MPPPLYLQTVIAFIWDFDRTLIPGYQQRPLFVEYGIDEKAFWKEVNSLPDHYRNAQGVTVNRDSAYLGHLLTYVRDGRLDGLTNAKLKDLGSRIQVCPGMPDFLDSTRELVKLDPKFQRHEIAVEHYIISTGLRPMIEGSSIGDKVDGIWACDFIGQSAAPGFLDVDAGSEPTSSGITQIGNVVDNTSKTRAVFEINKGTNKDPEIGINSKIPEEERRVPIKNMIYVADGPSDVPVFSVINLFGGKTYGVWNKPDDHTGSVMNFAQVRQLQLQGRIQGMGLADYREGTETHMWLMKDLTEIAEEIAAAREGTLHKFPGAPRHQV